MPLEFVLSHGVMEGNGAYNRYASIQAAGIASALPLLHEAVQKIELGSGDSPAVIVDYGCSQGRNSLAPMRTAIERLRPRLGANRPILVFHLDQASNDFNSLFETLSNDPGSYICDDPNVFPCAIGRSFYEQVLPPDSVHLAWSSYAAMWLSRIPCRVSGHFLPLYSSGSEREAFRTQAARDWRAFLSRRAIELRPGGRLVVVLAGLDDDEVSGFEPLMDEANAVLAEMVDEGEIRANEREGMVLATCPRPRRDLLAPFGTSGQCNGLTLEACELIGVPDPAWAKFVNDGDGEALASKRALFFRSTFVTSLALALQDGHDPERCRHFADQLESRLKRRLSEKPAPLHSFVQVLVAAKRTGERAM